MRCLRDEGVIPDLGGDSSDVRKRGRDELRGETLRIRSSSAVAIFRSCLGNADVQPCPLPRSPRSWGCTRCGTGRGMCTQGKSSSEVSLHQHRELELTLQLRYHRRGFV